MGLFSFRPISPQFAEESLLKPLKSVHPWGRHFGRPFSMVYAQFLDYLGVFSAGFAVKPCFQGLFCSISFNFQLTKHVAMAKKWQMRQERVVTNCNHAKNNENMVSTMALLHHIKSNFLVNFSSFWYLWTSYEYSHIAPDNCTNCSNYQKGNN